MQLPNFLVIGAMKAGTTSLHNYLDRHPEIFMSKKKELDYFVDRNFHHRDVDWYKAQFPTDLPFRGESSQNYSKRHHKDYQHIPERIHALLPDVKLVYIVRDPIERYRSHILENYYGDSKESRAYNEESGHYWQTSKYFFQLSAYLDFFSLENIHVLSLEELQQDRLGTMNALFRFLGATELEDPKTFDFVANAHEGKSIPADIKRSLPFRVIRKISPSLARKIIHSPVIKQAFFSQPVSKVVLSAQQKEELKQRLKEDVAQFRKLTGKDFPTWSL